MNYAAQPTLPPSGMKLELFREKTPASVALLHAAVDEFFHSSLSDLKLLQMVSTTLSTSECHTLLAVFFQHSPVFGFSQNDKAFPIPASRVRHRINTGSAQPIRQKPYRVSSTERIVISEHAEEMF